MIRAEALYDCMENGGDEDVQALVDAAQAIDAMIEASDGFATYDQIYEMVTDNAMTEMMRVDHEFGMGAADLVIVESAPRYARELREARELRKREDEILRRGGEALRAMS